jgi:hypothetical protein
VRLNEDSFSIQLRDYRDRIHSFWKSDLQGIRKDRKNSPMPPYVNLPPGELDDLLAYLSSLRGER